MKQTIQDQLVTGLLRYGMIELRRTSKYRRFECPKTGYHFFVGRAGALRVSRHRKATDTAVVGDSFRVNIFTLGSDVVTDPAKIGF